MKQKNYQPKEIRRSQILNTIFLFFIILSVMAFIVFGLRRFNLIKFPGFIENIFYFGGANGGNAPVDEKYIESLLRKYAENASSEESGGVKIITAEITGENLISMLSALEIPEALYAETQTVHYSSGAERRISAVLRKSGNRLSFEASENGSPSEWFIIDAGTGEEYYRNYITGSDISYQTEFGWKSVPNLYLAGEYFSLAAGGVISEFEVIRGKDGDKENILSFTFLNEALKQREEYKISLDSGIVKSITSYFGDTKYYEYTASKVLFSADAEDMTLHPLVNDSWFEIK